MPENNQQGNRTGVEIAIIGMAGRFPGANNIDEFWNNLKNGIESLSFFPEEELNVLLVDPNAAKDPNYVKCNGGILENKEQFDAFFFDYTPREAELMDPQMRIFHECVWEALENAGYDSYSYNGLIGIYAGASSSFEWGGIAILSGKKEKIGGYEGDLLIDKDFLSTRIAYKFDLKGPAAAVNTACSTSLVAVHMACQAILDGECDIALAGGVSISPWQNTGYLYQEGMIPSPDGHCRAFDARAKGVIGGNGAGVVVLKAFENAAAEGDLIHAVIKGTATNNDGTIKAGYTAPGRQGQTEVIRVAQQVAEVEPETISYIETHGTGTAIGDPIEIEALKQVFDTNKKGFCAIGSLKTNIGHLDAAAGAASLIKTVLALKNRLIPPSLHYETPNPKIDFENSPFYVNSIAREWKHNGGPLRAGVSSFGIGGTNAHVVLEEAPSAQSAGRKEHSASRQYQLIVLSAKTPSALEKMTVNLTGYFKGNPHVNLADAAYTLQVGRRALPHRRMCVCSTTNQVIDALTNSSPGMLQSFEAKIEDRPVIFMFPGQGAQYVDMGLDLYRTEPIFKEEMDRCFEILKPLMGYDLKEILYPHSDCRGGSLCPPKDCIGSLGQGHHRDPTTEPLQSDRINQTHIAQPVIFSLEYALAKLLIKWGIKPDAMIGHSIGEYTAACLAGVFTLKDALKLVASRGQLMQKMPSGSMLSISLPADTLMPLPEEQLSMAAVNTPSLCVVSGPHRSINTLAQQLKRKGHQCRKLHTSHAFHSPMMDPILKEFEEKVKEIQLSKPAIPYISNLSGKWITVEETVDPGYWARHLRKTVRFTDGVNQLLKNENAIFVEIGPGKTLSAFVRQHVGKKPGQFVVNLLRHPKENITDDDYLLNKIGQLWLYGKTVDWREFYSGQKRYRVSLPTYPFEAQHYWIDLASFKMNEMGLAGTSPPGKKKDISAWFYIPSWKRTGAVAFEKGEKRIFSKVLIFTDESGLGPGLAKGLAQEGKTVLIVKAGNRFEKESHSLYTINPKEGSHYKRLFRQLKWENNVPESIIHLWSLTGKQSGETGPGNFEEAQYLGFYSHINILQAVRENRLASDFKIIVVSDNIHDTTGDEILCPEKATVMGPAMVFPQEFSNIGYRCIDVVLPQPGGQKDWLIQQLLAEIAKDCGDTVIAYRNGRRWVQTYEPVQWDEEEIKTGTILKEKGVYLITGGLGGIGRILAKYLARVLQARIILTGRSPFPGRTQWEKWLAEHDKQDPISLKIRDLLEIEAAGAETLVLQADVSNYQQMQDVIQQSEEKFGPINGLFHAAGVTNQNSNQCPVHQLTGNECEEQFKPKVYGLLVLEELLRDKSLDFCLLMSSLSTVLGGLGFTAYAAANRFMDALAQKKRQTNGQPWIAVDWDGWKLQETANPGSKDEASPGQLAILPGEGEIAFQHILSGHGENRLVVSTSDLQRRIEQWIELESLKEDEQDFKAAASSLTARPNLTTSFQAPRDQVEQSIAAIWENFFGYEHLGIHDDFFELGGDSLKMMTVVSRIYKELEVEIPIMEFFNHSTIGGLAGYIRHSRKSKEFRSIEAVEKKEFHTLSAAQERVYVLQELDKNTTGYNTTHAVVLEGEIHRAELEEAFGKLIKRHEVLRTSIQLVKNEPVQVIHENPAFTLEYSEAGEDQIREILERFVRPFDLGSAPFFRAGLIKTGEQRHIFVLDIHHIITDAVSYFIFINDFSAFLEGSLLPSLKLQYKDFSEWQNSRQGKESTRRQEEYWLKQFEGQVPLLDMPMDFPRPEKRGYQGKIVRLNLEEEFVEKLDRLVRQTETTRYMVLLSVYTILLSRYTRQEDIVVGSPILGRRHSDLQNIMGIFVNLLAMRNRPCAHNTYREFLAEVKKNALNAFENQDCQFDELVIKLGLQGSQNRNPLFDTVFEMMYEDNSRPGQHDNSHHKKKLKVTPYDLGHRGSVFDLILCAYELEDNISLELIYSTALYKRVTAEKMAGHYRDILNQVIEEPNIKLNDISISHELLKIESRAHLEEEGDFAF